jgi:peroxiredoxin
MPETRPSGTRMPQLPFRPGRPALSKRTRFVLLVTLLAAFVVAIAVGALLARSRPAPLRAVTIPAADRDASPELFRAAAAVGFHPLGQSSGVGELEGKPASAARPPISGNLLPVGATAPAFSLRTPTGELVRLADLRGRAVLIEFFTTWCPHCSAEAPHMQRLYASLPKAAAAFVAVDANGEDAASVLAYHIYYGLGFPAVLDPSGRAVTFPEHGSPGPVTRSYDVCAYPTFYVLEAAG